MRKTLIQDKGYYLDRDKPAPQIGLAQRRSKENAQMTCGKAHFAAQQVVDNPANSTKITRVGQLEPQAGLIRNFMRYLIRS